MSETEELQAGRRLDAEIAERIFGHQVTWLATALSASAPHYEREGQHGYASLPAYSTDVAAMWLVVERLREQGRMVSLNWLPDSKEWYASVYPPPGEFGAPFHGYGDTAPFALCEAALLAFTPAGRGA